MLTTSTASESRPRSSVSETPWITINLRRPMAKRKSPQVTQNPMAVGSKGNNPGIETKLILARKGTAAPAASTRLCERMIGSGAFREIRSCNAIEITISE